MSAARIRRPTARRPTARHALVALLVVAAAAVLWWGSVDDRRLRVGDDRAEVAPASAPGSIAAVPPVDAGSTTPATGLDPELAARFAAAQQAATADGVELTMTSGRRTPEEQEALVADALARYGDPAEAHRWVLPPETSAHVQGLAIDVGPTEGAYWLQEHGLEHGLCPTYANEVWHFEMLPAGAQECPEPHRDSSWGW